MRDPDPIILVDMDGPFADFDRRFFELCDERRWALDVEFGAQTARFATDHIVDPEHRRLARAHVDTTPGWFRDLPVVEGAREGLYELASRAEVWIVTKPLESNPTCRDDKGAWVAEHLGESWLQRLIIAPDKSMVYGHILLDDAPKVEWLDRAWWAPVIYPTPFNAPGGKWSDDLGLSACPRWTWGDRVNDLLACASEARANLADPLR